MESYPESAHDYESASLTTEELIAMLKRADSSGKRIVSLNIALFYGTSVISVDLTKFYRATDNSLNIMAKQLKPEVTKRKTHPI